MYTITVSALKRASSIMQTHRFADTSLTALFVEAVSDYNNTFNLYQSLCMYLAEFSFRSPLLNPLNFIIAADLLCY